MNFTPGEFSKTAAMTRGRPLSGPPPPGSKIEIKIAYFLFRHYFIVILDRLRSWYRLIANNFDVGDAGIGPTY